MDVEPRQVGPVDVVLRDEREREREVEKEVVSKNTLTSGSQNIRLQAQGRVCHL